MILIGAGNRVSETRYRQVINEALIRGTNILKDGGSAMDACEAAITRLENSGSTNAGFGSNLTWDGTVECDASIMNGANLQFGACTNVSKVKNPIQLARIICDRQTTLLEFDRIPPMVLAGEGANQFARETGCKMFETEKLISKRAKTSFNYYKNKINVTSNGELTTPPMDTVGAICVDKNGTSAAGCSSGGLLLKMVGRVGQAATYGAGCWAVDTSEYSVATCTTGCGEYLMKSLLAKEISTNIFDMDTPVLSLHKTFQTNFLESPFLRMIKDLYGGALSLVYNPKVCSGELLWCHSTISFCLGYMSTYQKVPKVCMCFLFHECMMTEEVRQMKRNLLNKSLFRYSK